MMDKKLAGIISALVTPFDAKGKVNHDVLAKNVEYQCAHGIEGFYVCGSTGEAFLLSAQERNQIVKTVCAAASGKVSVIAHCGSIGTDLTIALAEQAMAYGADAVSAVTPFYYGFSPDEVIGYYKDLATAVQAPTIVYNIPKLSGFSITGSMMSAMREEKHIVGLKFTSQNLFSLERIKTDDPDLIVYNGFDEMLLAGLSVGADGGIGSTYNIMGMLFLELRDAFNLTDQCEALRLQKVANHVIETLVGTGKLFACLKYILKLRGFDFGGCRRPFTPLSDVDKKVCEHMNAYLLERGIES